MIRHHQKFITFQIKTTLWFGSGVVGPNICVKANTRVMITITTTAVIMAIRVMLALVRKSHCPNKVNASN